MLLVLTGPASSGKDTILFKLLEKYPNLNRIVTTTTRPPRQGEIHGKDYNFVSKPEFEEMIGSGQMLEYVDFSGDLYGTSKDAFKSVLEGKDGIWRIEMSRAGRISEFFTTSFPSDDAQQLIGSTKVIYIDVPNWDILRQRLKIRGDSPEQIERRLSQDKSDFEEYGSNFKHIVINEPGKLDETLDKIGQILENRNS